MKVPLLFIQFASEVYFWVQLTTTTWQSSDFFLLRSLHLNNPAAQSLTKQPLSYQTLGQQTRTNKQPSEVGGSTQIHR